MIKYKNVIGLILFCLFTSGYFFYKEYQKSKPEKIIQKNLDTNFFGKIDSLYIDHHNHGWLTIILSTKKTLRFNGSDRFVYKKNDSIVKHKGEDSVYIYRNGAVKAYKY